MNKIENQHLKRAHELLKDDQAGRAKRLAERVLRFNPGLVEALELIAKIEMLRGRFQAAIPLLEQATEGADKTPESLSMLGFCYRVTRQDEKALKAFREAHKKDPKQFQALFGLAGVYIGRGDMENAQKFLEKAIAVPSQNLEGYRLLATLTPKAGDKKFLKTMVDLLPKVKDFPATEKAHLEFAIAAACQKQGKKDDFAQHLHAANKHLQTEAQPWFEANELAYQGSRQVFTKEIFKGQNPLSAKKFTPIFIVGLPRSGSTLLEQILASHTKVFGADEMPYIRSLLVEDMTRHYGKVYPKFLPEMTAEEKISLAGAYQEKVRALAPKRPFIIDKMVGNSFFVGMIKMVLPWAKVIHVKRHPADIALSMYSSFFSPKISYANDLGELAKYFRMHAGYMDLWEEVCPGFVYHVKYEDLVKNQEQESRKIIKFCGLKWEPGVLDFHKTDRTVLTLSAGQVRKQIYTSSIGKWKDYNGALKPFIAGTQDLYKKYGY